MNARRSCCVFALTVAALFVGCATFGTYETAQTAPPGRFLLGGAITAMHYYSTEGSSAALFFPFPEISAKLGVSPTLELGARWAFGPGMTFTGKYQFLKGKLDGAVSLYGSFYGIAVSGASIGFYGLSPRVIFSSEEPGSMPYAFNLGANLQGVAAGAEGTTVSGSAIGLAAGAGLPFRVGAARSARVMPEISLNAPLTSSFKVEEQTGSQSLLGNFTVSLGVGFGAVGHDNEGSD